MEIGSTQVWRMYLFESTRLGIEFQMKLLHAKKIPLRYFLQGIKKSQFSFETRKMYMYIYLYESVKHTKSNLSTLH